MEINLEKYTAEQWIEYGLLDDIPDNRKELITNSLKYLFDVLNNDNEYGFYLWLFPIIIRIARVIDITKDEIDEIINETRKYRKKFMIETPSHLVHDNEMEFVKEYSDNKIEELKQKREE